MSPQISIDVCDVTNIEPFILRHIQKEHICLFHLCKPKLLLIPLRTLLQIPWFG